MIHQPQLLVSDPVLPEGFQYQPDLVSAEGERLLAERIRELPLRSFQFQGYEGKRRVVSYGWEYDFNERLLREADNIPPFLLPLRDLAAQFAGIAAALLPHVLITEYA